MRCQDIMKRDVECVSDRDSIQRAAQKMRDEGVGFLPVCMQDKRVLGTITDRDIAIRVCSDDRSAAGTKVGDVMTREAVSCRADEDIDRARALMAEHHKSRILCVEDKGVLVGVISLSDIAQHEDDAAGATLREISSREAHP
jgi:CBS domain-containing protein